MGPRNARWVGKQIPQERRSVPTPDRPGEARRIPRERNRNDRQRSRELIPKPVRVAQTRHGFFFHVSA